MIWTTNQGVASQLPGILRSGADVQRRFVQRFVNASALASESAVTAAILSQLTVNISYQSLQCEMVSVNPGAQDPPPPALPYRAMMMGESCVISGKHM
ncbi:hypothetical protein KIN20_027725 [Parelaphostrongylus tenuis]|uniref:Uncharacterized protein n=1 Tax=Parelaphostrongylus tenuis TaxID=148309 RepID=A0AAD5R019_PARTN|nr:hypothetical protein KIN20_027725 [Parelaphostrongylus tenuis]